MIYHERGRINTFPIGMKSADKYDVVYIGNLVPSYMNSHIPNLFYNDYVFLFTTMLNQDKDSYWYGHVNIDLVRHDQLSYFNHLLRERGSFHVLENETLTLNDFLEIIPEETDKGIQIIAHLKKQNIIGEDHRTVEKIKDFRVLLLRENKGDYFDNYPILELGPEFQTKLDLDEAEERYHIFSRFSFRLQGICERNKRDPEVISAIKVVQAALNKDIKNAEQTKEQTFERYLNLRKNLSYIHKRNF